MDLEEVQVATYLRGHPDFLQQWLERNADKQLLETVQRKWAQDSDNEEDEGPKKSSDSRPNVSLSVGLDLSSLNAKYNQALNKSPDDNDNEDDIMDDEPSPSVVPRTARKR